MLAGPANVLQAIADEPESMSAWELGLKDKIADLGSDGAKIEIVERGPVRGVVRFGRHSGTRRSSRTSFCIRVSRASTSP